MIKSVKYYLLNHHLDRFLYLTKIGKIDIGGKNIENYCKNRHRNIHC